MSFILDALRKSETERQRQAGPGIAEAGYRPPAPPRSVWLQVLLAVLVANLLLLAAFWWRNGARMAAPAASSAQAALRAQAPAPVVPQPHVVTPASAARAAGAEDPVTAPLPEPAAGANPATPRMEVLEPPPGPLPPASAGASAPPSAATGELPSADQLVTAGVLTGPPLHLDLHVYSARPAERFVFINTRKYTEGAEVQDGIVVEQITPDGVVLSRKGTRFSLARD
jgi:general secretion pathway protein B